MHTSFMAHGITSISVRSTTISAKTWTTTLVAMNDNGSIFELTLFSNKPLEIEGADHVNHVASAQEPMEISA